MPEITLKPIGFCKPDPIQAKRHAGTESHRQLVESVRRHGILQPPGVRPNGEAVWGTGRILAAIAAELKQILVVILDKPMTEGEYRGLTLTENLIRAGLAPIEEVDGVEEFASLNPGLSNKEVAERLSLNPSVVTRLRTIAACPIAHAALADGRLKGVSDAYTVAKAPDAQKAELLALRVSGASRDQIDEAARKQRKAATPQVRAKRIVCLLPSGVSVAVTGQRLSLDDLIDALGEVQKEAKRGREQKLDVKTWESVMRDKSRAQ